MKKLFVLSLIIFASQTANAQLLIEQGISASVAGAGAGGATNAQAEIMKEKATEFKNRNIMVQYDAYGNPVKEKAGK